MASKDWYKITFQIDRNSEEIIIWKLNDLGIFSYSFEFLSKTENEEIVNIWLPVAEWDKNSINNLELIIIKHLEIRNFPGKLFKSDVIKEEDWLTSWKKYWAPELVGKNLLILPYWLRLDEKYEKKKVIKLDPGAAFGTGSHPSTYLCLERIENIYMSGKKVLDIGSGSGILSITARSQGAKEICAIDNDYLAINSTKSNYRLNFGNLKKLKTYLGSFNEVIRKNKLNEYDFILCNILAEVIKGIIPEICRCLNKKGEVILSGILISQKDEIIEILNLNNLKLTALSSKKDWVCIAAKKI